jgi:hypothetical protein
MDSIFEESSPSSVISTIQIMDSDNTKETEPFTEEYVPEPYAEKEELPEEEPGNEDDENEDDEKPEPKKISRRARKKGFLTRLIEWIMSLFGSKRKE